MAMRVSVTPRRPLAADPERGAYQVKSALIVWGGWDGHEPEQVSEICAEILRADGFEVEISDKLESFADLETLKQLDLIVPVWTMGEIKPEYAEAVSTAVGSGVGMAG